MQKSRIKRAVLEVVAAEPSEVFAVEMTAAICDARHLILSLVGCSRFLVAIAWVSQAKR